MFRDEPAITVELERWSEGSTASVIAADVDRGWLLLDDVGTTEVSSEADTTSAIDLLVSLQRRSLVHRAGLAWAGCRRRPIGGLVDGVAAALDAEVTREAVPTDAPTQTRIVDGVTAAVAAVVDMPETLVHGDFHPGNAAATDHGIVLFDWSDACFAPPFIDVVTWTWWYTDDPDREEFVWRCFEAAWQREFGLDPLRLDRRAIQTVAAAFHLSSYVAVCEAVEPHRRADHIAGLIHFVDLLDRFCP